MQDFGYPLWVMPDTGTAKIAYPWSFDKGCKQLRKDGFSETAPMRTTITPTVVEVACQLACFKYK
jgi:hypothetical protein